MPPRLEVRRIASMAEAETCSAIMAATDPWVRLGRGYEPCLALMTRPDREQYVALSAGQIAGHLVLAVEGAFVGYIQTVCAAPAFRGTGVGTQLVAFAEERIFREFPNVFMCVSAFNEGARRLYARLGYEVVGELRDYVVAGESEILLRKTRGPMVGYVP